MRACLVVKCAWREYSRATLGREVGRGLKSLLRCGQPDVAGGPLGVNFRVLCNVPR
jgi:hypothetical protein